ncbi:MAG: protein BatD [bacterium]|nr:MAG: protein BatD [bacterium]
MKGKRILQGLIIFVLMIGNFYPLMSAEIEISTSVDRTVIGLNQTFTLTVDISGEKANNAGDPQMPDVSDFATYMGSSGTSSNIQIINGRMSVSKSISFTYTAMTLGKFTIPPAVLKFGNKEYRSQPIQIEIVKAPQQPQAQQRRTPRTPSDQPQDQTIENNLFLKVSANKRRVYVNEPVVLSYKIYTRVSVTQYGINKAPETAGFWVEEFPIGNQPRTYEEIVDGKKFIVAEIKRMALFPTDAGTKNISPMQIECDVRVQTRRRSIFDSFFDDPFFGRTVRQVVNSRPVTIEVLPLPQEGKPANFTGLVGNFNISAHVDKQAVKTNEAISLNIKISGKGNVKMIPAPKVELPPDFEKYEPKVSEKIDRTENSVSGYKNYEYVLIPRYPGLQKIKPVLFSYFDVATKQYKLLRTQEIIVNVEKGSDEFMTVTSGLSKEEIKLLGEDIRFIQLSNVQFNKIGSFFYKKFYFILILLFPILVVVSSLGYRRHLDKLSENVAYARSRKANQLAMKRLHKAKKLLSEKTQKDFYAEISNSLMGFLGDKFNIAAAGIITDEVEELMATREVDGQVIRQYLSCLQVCDYQRFAPSNAKLDEMKQFFNKAKRAIVALEKVI